MRSQASGLKGPLSLLPSACGDEKKGIITIIIINVGVPYTFMCLNGTNSHYLSMAYYVPDNEIGALHI